MAWKIYSAQDSCAAGRMAAYGCTGSAVRKEFHDYVGGLRVQLGAEERHLAAHVWTGVLRQRDDRFDDFAVRYGEGRSRRVPAVRAPGGLEGRCGVAGGVKSALGVA